MPGPSFAKSKGLLVRRGVFPRRNELIYNGGTRTSSATEESGERERMRYALGYPMRDS